MRRLSFITLLGAAAALGCGDDEADIVLPASYQITAPTAALRVGQDSLLSLHNFGVRVVRDGTDTINGPGTGQLPRLSYFIEDINIAYIDYNAGGEFGFIRGIKGGTTNLRVTGYGSEIVVPLEVTPYPATSIQLRVLTGPAGGLIPAAQRTDTGTFYALPAHRQAARLEGLILRNNDTLYCNYCAIKNPARVLRRVNFRSLDPALAFVNNAANPAAQRASGNTAIHNDTVGYVTAFDTTSTPVRIVMEVPGDGVVDTVYLKFKLRPIDTIRIMPGEHDVPATDVDDIGTESVDWPGDSTTGIATQSGNTNYGVDAQFLAFSQTIPLPPSTSTPTRTTMIVTNLIEDGVDNYRPNIPVVTWESAMDGYLAINAAGLIVAPCAFINGETCLAPTVRSDPPGPVTAAQAVQRARDSLVIQCVDNGLRLPGVQQNGSAVGPPIAFGGDGTLSFPNCAPVGNAPGPNIPMPGIFCTSAASLDLAATCNIWIRALATDPATGKALVDRYRVQVRR
jgi:hypothetical protein